MLLVLANSDWACSAQEFLSTSSQAKGPKCLYKAKHLFFSSPLIWGVCWCLLIVLFHYCKLLFTIVAKLSPAMPCHFGRISSNYQTNAYKSRHSRHNLRLLLFQGLTILVAGLTASCKASRADKSLTKSAQCVHAWRHCIVCNSCGL